MPGRKGLALDQGCPRSLIAMEGLETPLQRNRETYGEKHILQGEDLTPCSTEEIFEGNFRAFGLTDSKQGQAGSYLLQNRLLEVDHLSQSPGKLAVLFLDSSMFLGRAE